MESIQLTQEVEYFHPTFLFIVLLQNYFTHRYFHHCQLFRAVYLLFQKKDSLSCQLLFLDLKQLSSLTLLGQKFYSTHVLQEAIGQNHPLFKLLQTSNGFLTQRHYYWLIDLKFIKWFMIESEFFLLLFTTVIFSRLMNNQKQNELKWTSHFL